VIGAGAWGTALADLLARNGHEVLLWAYEHDVVDSVNMRHANPRFLPGAMLAPGVRATGHLDEAVAGAEYVVCAAPSHVSRAVLRGAAPAVPESATIIIASKGIERGTLALMSDVVAEELPGRPVVALSGPSFALEVAARQPTAVVAASTSEEASRCTQSALSNENFRVYTHDDVTGVELGGSLKNVVAIATGMAEGLGLGFNPRAALITRGLAEMARLGVALGAAPLTFAGLAGMGDLVLTCTGALSRNRALGVEIAKGTTLEAALAARETVAEGVITTQSARSLAEREGVEMPIVAAVHRILFEKQSPRDAITELMTRELRAEQDQ
jgi:glycerol-3-phosphate dehydrogenase (NAD(P)+)